MNHSKVNQKVESEAMDCLEEGLKFYKKKLERILRSKQKISVEEVHKIERFIFEQLSGSRDSKGMK